MPERVKVGVVGLGSLSQRGTLPHTYQADAREKIVPVAVCDPVPGRADAVAERWLWEQAYTDYAEMIHILRKVFMRVSAKLDWLILKLH